MRRQKRPPTYGVIAQFENPTDAVAAARRAYEEGYRRMDAFSPYPIEALSEAVGVHGSRLPLIVLIGGIVGGLGGYLMQYWMNAYDYALNVGGKPLHSWPAFIPKMAASAAPSTVVSNVIGMKAGQLCKGFPPTFSA
jgi:hypothetical protein